MVDEASKASNVAAAALLLLTAVLSIIIFLCSLCLARRRKDPTRSWLALYKVAFGCFVLSTILIFFNYLLTAWYTQLNGAAPVRANASSVVSNTLSAQVETGIVGPLFDEFAVTFALVALLGLAVAVSLAQAGKDSAVDRILLLGGYGLAAVLGILSVVAFALSEREYTIARGNPELRADADLASTAWDLLRYSRNVTFFMLAIRLVFNIAVLVKSILVAVKTKSEPRVTTATRYLLVCCALLLLKTSYDVGYFARYVPLGDPQSAPAQPGACDAILDVVLNVWPMFIAFVILFALGVKKQQGGLWATEQPIVVVHLAGEGMLPHQATRDFEYLNPEPQELP
ncbi:Uncharacterized protein TCAP_06468 [Tolypocladium capitatum]|uniref:Uncharacterized protein n=1 Tax=Tolypocladium capitatum TaxID=45235 RepID=A0A2K3Q7Z5_9HYPO|nr:Uncharacterized protein TCAP_06468 [Tolypocladium capitatum]